MAATDNKTNVTSEEKPRSIPISDPDPKTGSIEEFGAPDYDANIGPPPDGGLKAWLVVLGASFANFCAFGYIQSFA
jgi:hypothetical protein